MVFALEVEGAYACSGQYDKPRMSSCSTTDLPPVLVGDRSRLSILTEEDVSVWLENV